MENLYMSTLIILGNTNQFTFANSLIAAHSKAVELFEESVENIFIIHSSDSDKTLHQSPEWMEHLKGNNVGIDKLIHRIIDLDTTPESIETFVHYIEFIMNGFLSHNSNVLVDLTNSTTLYKNLLSNVAYILDFRHQYVIDTAEVFKKTKEKGFLPLNILQTAYVPLPEATQLDNIAYLNLTEMVRYKRSIQKHTEKYIQIGEADSDKNFFESNLAQSIQLKLRGDQKRDNAIYRIAASAISASVEDLVTILLDKFILTNISTRETRKTFGEKLDLIQSRIEEKTPSDFDFEFFRTFNAFMLYLRNSSTHKSSMLTDIERFKADLSVKMSFPFIEFYTDIVYPLLSSGNYAEPPKKIIKLSASSGKSGNLYYFGLDGDNTGSMLENLFLSAQGETAFKRMSNSIDNAIKAINKHINTNLRQSNIIFAAGDDILFKAEYDEPILHELKQIYQQKTAGLTCSIGYGRSFREVYLALKLAKMESGKNSIVGVELV